MTTSEEWRPAPGLEGRYEISSLGRLRNAKTGKVRKMNLTPGGYVNYSIHRAGERTKRDNFAAHRMVALAFLPPSDFSLVRHLDGNKLNNCAINLSWGTVTDNNRDTVTHGRNRNAAKTHCPKNHPYTEENTYVNPNTGYRRCRTCVGPEYWKEYNKMRRAPICGEVHNEEIGPEDYFDDNYGNDD